MSDLIYDEQHDDKVKLSAAVLRVCNIRHDLNAAIMHAHRDLVERYSDKDPFVSSAELHGALAQASAAPNDPKHDGARLQLIDALLHGWYRVDPDLKARVMQAVKEVAILNGEDPDQACASAYTVLNGARSAGAALTEQKRAHEARAEKRRAKRDNTEVDEMRKRLQHEAQA